MDMRALLNPDNQVIAERSTPSGPSHVLPQKRKVLDSDSSRNSRDTTPRPLEASDTHTPNYAILHPCNHILRPPTFVPTSEPGYFSTNDVPASRNYRYIPAVLSATYDPVSDELPYYQTGESTPASCVRVSWEDRSPFIRVTEDGLGLGGERGFRSARLNVPIREGQWYFEVQIINGDGDSPESTGGAGSSHIRLGWARREASLSGPAGLDGYSYGIRDKTGEKITLSRPRPYGKPFRTGDVVGLYISLPPRREANPKDPNDPARIVPKRTPIQYRGSSYFEASEYLPSKEMAALMENPDAFKARGSLGSEDCLCTKSGVLVKNTPGSGPSRKRPGRSLPSEKPVDTLRPLPTLPSSAISFFLNGEDQGVAFRDVYSYLQLEQQKTRLRTSVRTTALKERENHFDDGTLGYYPFISLFGNAKVRINAGPKFEHAPPAEYRAEGCNDIQSGWRPLCERYSEYLSELRAIDTEEERQLRAAKLAAALERKLMEQKDLVKKEKVGKAFKANEKRKDKEKKVPGHSDTNRVDLPPEPSLTGQRASSTPTLSAQDIGALSQEADYQPAAYSTQDHPLPRLAGLSDSHLVHSSTTKGSHEIPTPTMFPYHHLQSPSSFLNVSTTSAHATDWCHTPMQHAMIPPAPDYSALSFHQSGSSITLPKPTMIRSSAHAAQSLPSSCSNNQMYPPHAITNSAVPSSCVPAQNIHRSPLDK
jgi:COMPASS component BRE2